MFDQEILVFLYAILQCKANFRLPFGPMIDDLEISLLEDLPFSLTRSRKNTFNVAVLLMRCN